MQYLIVFILSLCFFYVLGTVLVYETSLITFTVDKSANRHNHLLLFKAKQKSVIGPDFTPRNDIEDNVPPVENENNNLDDENERTATSNFEMKNNQNIVETNLVITNNKPWKKGEAVGKRNQYRSAHEQARFEGQQDDFLPFNQTLVASSVKNAPRLEVEVEYFRFRDEFGLIDTGWDDHTVITALQSLVDIWAQANIWLKIRKSEALAFVNLSRQRKLGLPFPRLSNHPLRRTGVLVLCGLPLPTTREGARAFKTKATHG